MPTKLWRIQGTYFIFFASDVSSTTVGLKVKDGVVLGVEKLIQSKLLVPGSNKRIQTADLHVGVVWLSVPSCSL